MGPAIWRGAAWAAFLFVAIVRPGVDALDRRLVGISWNIPSEWNAIADVAMRSGVVDPDINGSRAPWRQASVVQVGNQRLAVVVVSDMSQSRATFMTDDYEVLGTFVRATTDPALVTDETRGYKPLSHIWPIVEDQGRLQTLIALAPLKSEPPTLGVFAYLGVGPRDTELLFVCRLRWAPGPAYTLLDRVDLNGDGLIDVALYADGRKDVVPVATFQWNPASREYVASISEGAKPFLSWWSTSASNRVTIQREEAVDDAVAAILARFGSPDGAASTPR
jgi:hypothetical protein